MPNRNVEGNYRYKFQGQEKDSETGKEAFELRLWDGRIGRWLTTDPYGQYSSPYVGMGNDPINGIDPDGGYKTKWGRFWGWVGGGFQGKFVGDGTASNPYKNYGIQKGRFLDDGQGSFGGTLELYNDYGDWKSAAAADIQADWRNAEFQEQYMTTYDNRLSAIASHLQLALPNSPNLPKFKLPSLFNKAPKFNLNNPNSFRGANPRSVGKYLKSNGWKPAPTNPNKMFPGTRYTSGVSGEQIRIMPGNVSRSIHAKQGPHMIISRNGVKSEPIPLMGNSTLK